MTVLYGPDGKPISVVVGNVAHDAIDSGNPVKIGGKARTAEPTAVADNDRVNAYFGPTGRQAISDVVGGPHADGIVNTDAAFPVSPDGAGRLLAVMLSLFNGTTWDRMRGDITNGLDVDVTRSALPTGAATAANQATEIGHLDGVEGLLATIDADTGAIVTAAQIMDDWDESDRAKVNPIAGQAGVQGASGVSTALTQRVVLATDIALPAGTNAIGKLAANSGVDIGDVDVTSSATLANGQVNVTNSAATLVAARTGRKRLTLVNRQLAPIFVGIATVTTANGFQIDAGASLTLETSALIQGITAAASGATEKTHYIEEYT